MIHICIEIASPLLTTTPSPAPAQDYQQRLKKNTPIHYLGSYWSYVASLGVIGPELEEK